MKKPHDPIARAFELAQSGKFSGIADIKSHLKSEGYSLSTIDGPALMRQLRELIKQSKPPRP